MDTPSKLYNWLDNMMAALQITHVLNIQWTDNLSYCARPPGPIAVVIYSTLSHLIEFFINVLWVKHEWCCLSEVFSELVLFNLVKNSSFEMKTRKVTPYYRLTFVLYLGKMYDKNMPDGYELIWRFLQTVVNSNTKGRSYLKLVGTVYIYVASM